MNEKTLDEEMNGPRSVEQCLEVLKNERPEIYASLVNLQSGVERVSASTKQLSSLIPAEKK